MTTYLLRPDGSHTRRSTILAPCGFDSTAEAGHAATGYMALPRGHNILFWDGPGQGGMLYEYGVPMRPDFESVVSPSGLQEPYRGDAFRTVITRVIGDISGLLGDSSRSPAQR
jgi:hypothetical protein